MKGKMFCFICLHLSWKYSLFILLFSIKLLIIDKCLFHFRYDKSALSHRKRSSNNRGRITEGEKDSTTCPILYEGPAICDWLI